MDVTHALTWLAVGLALPGCALDFDALERGSAARRSTHRPMRAGWTRADEMAAPTHPRMRTSRSTRARAATQGSTRNASATQRRPTTRRSHPRTQPSHVPCSTATIPPASEHRATTVARAPRTTSARSRRTAKGRRSRARRWSARRSRASSPEDAGPSPRSPTRRRARRGGAATGAVRACATAATAPAAGSAARSTRARARASLAASATPTAAARRARRAAGASAGAPRARSARPVSNASEERARTEHAGARVRARARRARLRVPRARAVAPDATASSADREARARFESGRLAFDDQRYEEALADFERSYELSGRSIILFNIGLVHDRLRRDGEALDAFRRYLEAVPDAENRAEVERRIEVLQAALDERRWAPQPAPMPMPDAQAAPASPSSASMRPLFELGAGSRAASRSRWASVRA